jgi:hypothetical protein
LRQEPRTTPENTRGFPPRSEEQQDGGVVDNFGKPVLVVVLCACHTNRVKGKLMATALLIKTTGEVETTDIPNENSYVVLNELCEGWLDCVRNEDIVGYVNDEGLLIGLAPNIIASVLFGRPLVGNVVVLGALNDEGEYDGDNHDVPEQYLSAHFRKLAQALIESEEVVNTVHATIADIDLTPKVTTLTDEQFDAWLNGEGV